MKISISYKPASYRTRSTLQGGTVATSCSFYSSTSLSISPPRCILEAPDLTHGFTQSQITRAPPWILCRSPPPLPLELYRRFHCRSALLRYFWGFSCNAACNPRQRGRISNVPLFTSSGNRELDSRMAVEDWFICRWLFERPPRANEKDCPRQVYQQFYDFWLRTWLQLQLPYSFPKQSISQSQDTCRLPLRLSQHLPTSWCRKSSTQHRCCHSQRNQTRLLPHCAKRSGAVCPLFQFYSLRCHGNRAGHRALSCIFIGGLLRWYYFHHPLGR